MRNLRNVTLRTNEAVRPADPFQQYVLENADEIVIGQLNPDGLLAFQLSDLPQDTPVTDSSRRLQI